jgi:hypothetical protein
MLSFNLSEPVTLKRFLALDLVFIFIFPSVLIYSYLLSLRGTSNLLSFIKFFYDALYKAIFLAIQFLYRQNLSSVFLNWFC